MSELAQRLVTAESSHLPSGWRKKREEGLTDALRRAAEELVLKTTEGQLHRFFQPHCWSSTGLFLRSHF